jgi:hypothetical protein
MNAATPPATTDPILERRLALHEAFAHAIISAGTKGATEEDALAALASCALAILSQSQDPARDYGKFLQDIAVMWMNGRAKLAAAAQQGR